MAECLGEVTEQFDGAGVDFLGRQIKVVAVTDGALEYLSGAFGPAGHGQRLSEPEGAQQERALTALQAVGFSAGVVPVDQAALVDEPCLYRRWMFLII